MFVVKDEATLQTREAVMDEAIHIDMDPVAGQIIGMALGMFIEQTNAAINVVVNDEDACGHTALFSALNVKSMAVEMYAGQWGLLGVPEDQIREALEGMEVD